MRRPGDWGGHTSTLFTPPWAPVVAWLGAPSFPSVDLALAPCLPPYSPKGWAVPHKSCSSPRHELSRLRQPDAGSAAGPHGAVPDALKRGKAGPALSHSLSPFLSFPPPSVPSLSFLCLVPDFSSFLACVDSSPNVQLPALTSPISPDHPGEGHQG